MTVVVSVLAVLAMLEYAGLAFAAQPRERALAVVLGTIPLVHAISAASPTRGTMYCAAGS